MRRVFDLAAWNGANNQARGSSVVKGLLGLHLYGPTGLGASFRAVEGCEHITQLLSPLLFSFLLASCQVVVRF